MKEVEKITFSHKSGIGYRNLHKKIQFYIFNRDKKNNIFIARLTDKKMYVMYINKSQQIMFTLSRTDRRMDKKIDSQRIK